MPLTPETEAEILRRHHADHWPAGTIATQLNLHRDSVVRILVQAGLPTLNRIERPSAIDPYLPFIRETLAQFPRLRASRLYRMVKDHGYPGKPDHFRRLIARHRPRPKSEAYLRLRTLPGEQCQIDWGHFGHLEIGQASFLGGDGTRPAFAGASFAPRSTAGLLASGNAIGRPSVDHQ